ncbi:MAG: glycerophosphoryl diester phosphodiesterase [Haloquadratum sp. J07HQX50]|jgi:Glycerophosphoryl diester phosphodiesterase|nr:MAG: glycerophosphoryl diester phosphodiesterase [Haloquadratum sp. J07HQX50]
MSDISPPTLFGINSPVAIAHRGAADRFPENTVAAARGAAPHVDMIEIDVRRCASGEVVVIHDATLDRLCGVSAQVSETTLSTLSSLSVLGSNEAVPPLSAVLSAIPSQTAVNIEIKEEGILPAVRDHVSATDNDILISSFLPTVVSEAAESDIEAQTALIIASWSDAILDQPIECTAIHPAADILTPERITRCLNSGYAVNAWRVQTDQRVKNLIHNGVTGLIVDDWELLA